MLRIFHITATHVNELGGMGVVLFELIRAQNRIQDVESKLISLKYPISTETFEYSNYVPTQSLGAYLHTQKPDIVILHSYFEIEYRRVAQILNANNVPYLIEPHGGFMPGTYKKSRYKKIVADITVFRTLLKNAKGFIFLNESEKESSVHHKDVEIVIPNGIMAYTNIESKSENIKNGDPFKLYYIGRYDIHEKGIDILMDALKILDDQGVTLLFDFYGSGSQESIQYILDRSKELSNVKITENGTVYGDKKIEQIQGHDILVLLSKHEGYPVSVLEAWNAGIGCILTKETNLGLTAEKYCIGWCTEASPKGIAITIKRALSEVRVNSLKIRENCARYIKEECNWDNIAQDSVTQLRRALQNIGI